MKFILDVGLGKKVDTYLISKGYDIICIRDIDPRMSDEKILDLAVQKKCVVITMDKDFGELVYNYGKKHCGVLLLRLEDERTKEKISVISTILNEYMEQLDNHFCVYQNGTLRIRK